MRIAPDRSPVELYARLPERTADAELVHRLLPPAGDVLDLGVGTGRLAEPLARLGHPVVGVDDEPAMLARLRAAAGVRADVTTLAARAGLRTDATLNAAGTLVLLRPVSDAGGVDPDEARSGR